MGFCNCSMFCYALLYVHSGFVIVWMGKRGVVALLSLYSWGLVIVVLLFLLVPWFCLRLVIVACPDHTQFLFFGNSVLSLYASSVGSSESTQMHNC